MTDAFVPTPKQWAAFCCPAEETFFGGAAGGGKTRFDFEYANAICDGYPGARVAIFRRTTPQLRKLKDEAQKFLGGRIGVDISMNRNTGEIRYANGSVIHLNHAHREHDIENNLSEEYALIIFDEAGTFLAYQLAYARTRNRTPIRGLKPFMVLTSNPLGVGMYSLLKEFVTPSAEDVDEITHYFPWWKARELEAEVREFYDPRDPDQRDAYKEAWIRRATEEGLGWVAYPEDERPTGRMPEPGKKGHDEVDFFEIWRPKPSAMHLALGLEEDAIRLRAFIPSWLQDNYDIDYNQYAANLAGNEELSEDVRKALLLGHWDVFEGQFFREFKEETHVVDPVEPEEWWYHWGSMDHGFGSRAMLVVQFHTYNPETKQRITYDEIAVNETPDEAVAEMILRRMQGRPVRDIYADPSMWKQGGGMTYHADTYLRLGVPLRPANNQRKAGWMAVRNAMARNPETGQPNWVVTRNCRYLIETLPTLVYDDSDPEDINQDGHIADHAADCLRYGMIGAPVTQMSPVQTKAPSLGKFVNRTAVRR